MRARFTILLEFLGTVCIATGGLLVPVTSRATEPTPGWHPSQASYARTEAVPSHDGRYRASLRFDRTVRGGDLGGEVVITAADGTPVTGAQIALASWMPEHDSVMVAPPVVTAELGAGRYRVQGLRFDRAGWWNVRATIAAPRGTDSLAFNLIR